MLASSTSLFGALYIGAAFKWVAFEIMEDYFFGWLFGMNTLLWAINFHFLLIYIKMQSAFMRCNSHSIVLESDGKKIIDFTENVWDPF